MLLAAGSAAPIAAIAKLPVARTTLILLGVLVLLAGILVTGVLMSP